MKKLTFLFVAVALFFSAASSVSAQGIDDPSGVPLYVIIDVEWHGDPIYDGSWTVYGPAWSPDIEIGPILSRCLEGEDCLDMSNYEFEFRGKTVQFDEVMVEGVTATPQAHHVVLTDKDGDGTYEGSLSASHYFPWRAEADGSWPILYFDRIDYDITFDQDGNVTYFHYLQYEHKKLEAES